MHDQFRRALTVGNSDYPTGRLRGCVEDARALAQLLRRHHDGEVNFDVEVLTSDQRTVTKALLRELLATLNDAPRHRSPAVAGHLLRTQLLDGEPACEVVVAAPPRLALVLDRRRAERVAIADDDHLGGDAEALGGFQREDVRPRGRAADDPAGSQPGEDLRDLLADEVDVGLGEVVGGRAAAGVEDDHPAGTFASTRGEPTLPVIALPLALKLQRADDRWVASVNHAPCTTSFVEH